MNDKRYYLHKPMTKKGPWAYLVSREFRLSDNFALYKAYDECVKNKTKLYAAFCITHMHEQYADFKLYFLKKSLEELEAKLANLNIPLFILTGKNELLNFLKKTGISTIITDFNPLRENEAFINEIKDNTEAAFIEADSHNIVPCREASVKAEYGAYTIRPKINKKLDKYLYSYIPELTTFPYNSGAGFAENDYSQIYNKNEFFSLNPGEGAAFDVLSGFIKSRLPLYDEFRNDPNSGKTSCLSPYLNLGNISSKSVANRILKKIGKTRNTDAFLEELIVRKELSDNFCFYNKNYDNIKGAPSWARESLDLHKIDSRDYLYSLEEFEYQKTSDALWNAAQKILVKTGYMHGYMRMYWAKKMLEWTPSAETALNYAVYLNDKYAIDGCDPNGYAGIMWSICGLHDRAWKERSVFGKVRYMNYNGCKRKFDVDKYIKSA